jgi:L-amino acid N-acyltransferase YncA
MKLNFRDATIHDLPAIVDIYNSTVPGRIVTADTEPVSVESRISWFEKHSPDKRPLWIIEDENKNTVGWASFQSFYGRPAYDGTVEISIYLHENARGKKIGKKTLEFAINNCERLGIKTLLGFIFAHNEPSLKLFKNFGFEEWAMLPNIATLDGIDRSLIILGKRITK